MPPRLDRYRASIPTAPRYYGHKLVPWLVTQARLRFPGEAYRLVEVALGQLKSMRSWCGQDVTIPGPTVQGSRLIFGCELIPTATWASESGTSLASTPPSEEAQ